MVIHVLVSQTKLNTFWSQSHTMPYPIGRSDLDSHDPTTTSRGLKAHRRTLGPLAGAGGWERQQGSWRRGRMGYVNCKHGDMGLVKTWDFLDSRLLKGGCKSMSATYWGLIQEPYGSNMQETHAVASARKRLIALGNGMIFPRTSPTHMKFWGAPALTLPTLGVATWG